MFGLIMALVVNTLCGKSKLKVMDKGKWESTKDSLWLDFYDRGMEIDWGE